AFEHEERGRVESDDAGKFHFIGSIFRVGVEFRRNVKAINILGGDLLTGDVERQQSRVARKIAGFSVGIQERALQDEIKSLFVPTDRQAFEATVDFSFAVDRRQDFRSGVVSALEAHSLRYIALQDFPASIYMDKRWAVFLSDPKVAGRGAHNSL